MLQRRNVTRERACIPNVFGNVDLASCRIQFDYSGNLDGGLPLTSFGATMSLGMNRVGCVLYLQHEEARDRKAVELLTFMFCCLHLTRELQDLGNGTSLRRLCRRKHV
jgi:hypothetical protein